MLLGGFQKLTLIDYPGKLAATVFTVGCSFRCPFCHNPELVLSSQFTVQGNKLESEFFKFLKSRKEKLEGICITGGEPTIQPDLTQFIRKVRKLGFYVKLDTNGTRPDVLRQLFKERLLDYVAMDIKSTPAKYLKTAGITETKTSASLLDRVKLSVELIRNSGVPYEFRTTVVPGLHSPKDFEKIAKWLTGAHAYYLQEYREERILDEKLKKITKGKKIDLEKIKNEIEKHFGKMEIRS
jgi:pyruvate formate lyase activating enzyme